MIGAIVGDVVGSRFEWKNIKSKEFELFNEKCHFTDDSVMTFAVFEALENCNGNYSNLENEAVKSMQKFGRMYPYAGYGGSFLHWLFDETPKPYGSYGNGSAMRIGAVAYFAKSLEDVKKLSHAVTVVTHSHEEGLKGAEATAVCTYLALAGKSKEEIKAFVEKNYYSLNFDYDDLVKNYEYDVTCQGTVPQAIFLFLKSSSFEDAIRLGISIGGDSDTICAIIGLMAGAYYGVPQEIENKVVSYLDETLHTVYERFKKKFEK